MSQDLRRRALALLRRAKVPYTLKRNEMWYDGSSVSAGPKLKSEDILHEAAHWLLSSLELRQVVNFGLGESPEPTPDDIESPQLVNDDIDQEVLASGAGILLVARLGGDYVEVMKKHDWVRQLNYDGLEDLANSAKRLEKAGVEISEKTLEEASLKLESMISDYIELSRKRDSVTEGRT